MATPEERDAIAISKRSELDKSKYVLVVETEPELSDGTAVRTNVVTKYEFATNNDDGDFVLYLDIDNFFDSTTATTCEPFSHYFHEETFRGKVSVCEGIRHYPVSPCPIRISVQNQETGKQAELFDFKFGRLWLYNSLEEYSHGILGVVIEADENKPTEQLLHIYNKCANLKDTTMQIVLFRASGTTKLGVRILVESFSENVVDFFESLDYK